MKQESKHLADSVLGVRAMDVSGCQVEDIASWVRGQRVQPGMRTADVPVGYCASRAGCSHCRKGATCGRTYKGVLVAGIDLPVNPEIDIFLAPEIICAELLHCPARSEQARIDLYLHAKAGDLAYFE